MIRLYILIVLILLWVTGYLFRINKNLKKQEFPIIASIDRPDVDKDMFSHGLEKGDIIQKDFKILVDALGKNIYGDKYIIYAILIALLSKGHILIQGAPGTGKTTLVRTFANLCGFSYSRIQCTPDLLPQDIIGTEIFDSTKKQFTVHYGPVVANLLHIDEINRATPKLQSAFLEVMQERTISIGKETKLLPEPFFVIATQNPYDAIGTYMLPYGQIDRFMLGVYTIGLDKEEEYKLLQDPKQQSLDTANENSVVFTQDTLAKSWEKIGGIQIEENVLHHAIQCIYIAKEYTSSLSTRASKSLLLAAKAWAFLQDKKIVEKNDIDAVLPIVLKHRISYILGKDINNETLYRIVTGVAQKDDIVG